MAKLSYQLKEGVALIGFGYQNEKSMTVLCETTLEELEGLVDAFRDGKKEQIKGLIFFTHKEGCFLAGVDIHLIDSFQTEAQAVSGAESGQRLYNKIEDLKVPKIACVHGVCLGGGTELILCCDRIFASDSPETFFGLPEVKLGILPGLGGTYRLPRRIGLPQALDVILTGKNLPGKKAKKMGLADEVYPKECLLPMAMKSLEGGRRLRRRRVGNLLTQSFVGQRIVFQKAREQVMKKSRGHYQAPLRILDTMEAGMFKGRESYLAHEAQAFGELCLSRQSKNLQHIFFMMEEAKKYAGPSQSPHPPRPLRRGAVVGAGTMGGGIAWLMAKTGMRPLMKDLDTSALELGLKQSSKNFGEALKRKRMTRDQWERLQRSLSCQTGGEGFKRMDLVIEAIVEDLEVKRKVFKELEQQVSPDCILATNTSSLQVRDMALVLDHPSRFVGLHFFNPVHRMPLVEIVRHQGAAPHVVEALYHWCLQAKKTPVVVDDGPGFLVNRLLIPYFNEAAYLLEEGIPLKKLEEACLNFGMPMGPCRLLDELGIDVAAKVGKTFSRGIEERGRERGMPRRFPLSKLNETIFQAGILGKKGGKGFYLYDAQGKEGGLNEEALLKLLPSEKIKMDEETIQKRLLLVMANEAATILGEGLVKRAAHVDLAMIMGTGFPPFRGGLLRWADEEEGLDKIYEKLLQFSEEVDRDRFAPSPYLKDLVECKKTFYTA